MIWQGTSSSCAEGAEYVVDEAERTFWLAVRQAVLMFLDALERRLRIEPTTADIRKQYKKS